MTIFRLLNAVGLALDIMGVVFLLRGGMFWQQALGWGKLRDIGRKIFEPTGKRTQETASLYGFLFLLSGFTLQLASPLLGIFTDSYQNPWPINWQAAAAIAAFLVVLVALCPIGLDAIRRRRQARSLRIRLCSKLTLLRPSLGAVIQQGRASYPAAVLSPEVFRETARQVEQMFTDSYVLRPNEQDQIAPVLANLELAAPLYGTQELTVESAKNLLNLIDTAVKIMGQEGLHGRCYREPPKTLLEIPSCAPKWRERECPG